MPPAGVSSAAVGTARVEQHGLVDQPGAREAAPDRRAAFDQQARDAARHERLHTAGSQSSPPIEPHRNDLGPGRRAAPTRRRPSAAEHPQRDAVARCRANVISRGRSSSRASTMRTGERASRPGRRQVSCGSSSDHRARARPGSRRPRARNRCPAARAAAPVTQRGLPPPPRGTAPSASSASLACTNGRRSVTRRMCPAASNAPPRPARRARPQCRRRAAARARARRRADRDPRWRHTTRVKPGLDDGVGARRRLAVVRAGSSVTYMVAPRARAPARAMASVSACGRPPGCVQPRAMTSPVRSSAITAPTDGLGAVRPRPRSAMPQRDPHHVVVELGALRGRITLNAS